MTNAPSVMPPDLRGVMKISSKRGLGKSWLAAQADHPQNVLFVDYEEKGRGLDEQLHFGQYADISAEAFSKGSNPIYLWQETKKVIDAVKPNTFTVAVFDNVSFLEAALKAEANTKLRDYVREFGLNMSNVESGRFGGISSVVNAMIGSHITARKAPYVGLFGVEPDNRNDTYHIYNCYGQVFGVGFLSQRFYRPKPELFSLTFFA